MSNNAHTWLRIAAVGLIAALNYFPHRHHPSAVSKAQAAAAQTQTTLATTAPAQAKGTELAVAP